MGLDATHFPFDARKNVSWGRGLFGGADAFGQRVGKKSVIPPLHRTIEGFLIGSGSGHQDIARSDHGDDLAGLDGGGPIQLGSGVFGNRARSDIE